MWERWDPRIRLLRYHRLSCFIMRLKNDTVMLCRSYMYVDHIVTMDQYCMLAGHICRHLYIAFSIFHYFNFWLLMLSIHSDSEHFLPAACCKHSIYHLSISHSHIGYDLSFISRSPSPRHDTFLGYNIRSHKERFFF